MRSLQLSKVGAVLLIFVLLSVRVNGQAVKGSLVGTVTDVSGAPVANAPIVIHEIRTGISRTVFTNASGAYTAPNIEPGIYTLTVEVPGFRKIVRENVELLVNSTVRVDMELQPGAVSETINALR